MTHPTAAQIRSNPLLAAATRQPAAAGPAALPIPTPDPIGVVSATSQFAQLAAFTASPAGWGRVTKVVLGVMLMVGGSIVLAYQTAFRPFTRGANRAGDAVADVAAQHHRSPR